MRRLRIHLAAALAVAVASVGLAGPATAADEYPTHNITLICALPPGSGADVIVRYFADQLAKKVPVSVIVENKAGASGNIAAEYVARSKPDGYTIYLHGANTIAANLNRLKNPPFKAQDMQVVSNVQSQAFMIAVAPNSPAKTLPELTALMKKKGAAASYGVSNIFAQIVGELYRIRTGLTASIVQYRTAAQYMNDLNSGALDYAVVDPTFAMAQEREGRLRILGISSSERMPISPDVPTMIEGGVPDMDMRSWFSTMVPAATPRPVVDKLNKWFNEILATEETRKFLASAGGVPFIVSPDEGQAMYLKANADYKDYVKQAGVTEN
ncbi:MAG TPA: tripartite tricarboxylate transporter substrate binding protein [Xanthobacteraceae bacterium]|nr:tripartite tricarboxylate transporter substrate binding protein [Xanthobacteraceae bacterium]